MTREEIKERIAMLEEEISRRYQLRGEDEWDHAWYVANIRALSNEQDELEQALNDLDNLEVKVGDGVTICCWTDCLAYTVIARTAKTITIQRDIAIRIDKNGMSDCQEYSYERDPDGETRVMRWSDKKHCWVDGCYRGHIGRHEYYDYSF